MSTYASSIPGASGYAGAAALANKAFANAMARYQQQRANSLLKYGLRAKAGGGFEADPSNEFGQFQQMWRNEANQGESLTRAQAASGWGSDSGYLGAQREDLSRAQGQEQTALGADVQGALGDITAGEQGAAFDRDAALYQAEQAAAERAIAGQQFNPGDYSGLAGQVDYGQKAAPPTVAPTRKAVPAKQRPTRASVHQRGRQAILNRRASRRKAVKRRG